MPQAQSRRACRRRDRYRRQRQALQRRLGRAPKWLHDGWPVACGDLKVPCLAGWVFEEPAAPRATLPARLMYRSCVLLARCSSTAGWALGRFGALFWVAVMAELTHAPGQAEAVRTRGTTLWLRRVIRRAGPAAPANRRRPPQGA